MNPSRLMQNSQEGPHGALFRLLEVAEREAKRLKDAPSDNLLAAWRMIQILSRKSTNNPVLIGAPGVSRTAIVEGRARRIVLREIRERLRDESVLSLAMTSPVTDADDRGEFEERPTVKRCCPR